MASPITRRNLLVALGTGVLAVGGALTLRLLGPEEPERSGRALPEGNWELRFSDDFDEPLDRSVWGVYDGPGNGQTGPRSARNTSVRDGCLVLRTAPVDGVWKAAGVSSARGGLAQTYGRFVVRARFEPGYGVRAVLLLWPASDTWPPEVDFFEVPATEEARGRMLVTNHFRDEGGARRFQRQWVEGDFTQWHEFTLDWTPDALVYAVDGRVVARMTEHVPQEPMWLGLQTAQGVLERGIVPDAARTPYVDFLVDRVEVYAPATGS